MSVQLALGQGRSNVVLAALFLGMFILGSAELLAVRFRRRAAGRSTERLSSSGPSQQTRR
jgi:hypothetical protein